MNNLSKLFAFHSFLYIYKNSLGIVHKNLGGGGAGAENFEISMSKNMWIPLPLPNVDAPLTISKDVNWEISSWQHCQPFYWT